MKIVGDKTIFAIAYDISVVTINNYYGNIWFWLNNKQVGTESADTYLSVSVHCMKQFFELKPLRRYLFSEDMTREQLFYNICEVFNKGTGTRENRYLNFNSYYDIFWLEDVGDANFRDEVKIVLLDEPALNRQRFLWKRYDDNKLEEAFIPFNYFEEVANAFIQQIEKDVSEWSKTSME